MPLPATPLAGKVAIVTGSGRGLGLAYAAELARPGRIRRRSTTSTPATADARGRRDRGRWRQGRRRRRAGRTDRDRDSARRRRGRELRAPRHPGHQRRGPARHRAVEDERRRLRHRHQRAPARHLHLRTRSGDLHAREGEAAGASSASARRPASAATSARPTTPPPRPASWAWSRTWALELKRAGITANAVIPVAATAMTATVPYFAAAVEADARRRADARVLPPRPRVRHVGRRRGAHRLSRVGCRGRASPARRSASAATASRCGRTPSPWSPRTATAAGRTTRSTSVRRRVRRAAAVAWARASRRCRTTSSAPPAVNARTMTRYEPAIDLDALDRDRRARAHRGRRARASSLPDDAGRGGAQYFSADGPRPDLDSIAAYYRERRMAAVVFTVDATHRLGHPAISSAEIAEGAARNNDVLIPFGSVDPARARTRSTRAQRLVDESGVRGFKFHPTVQGFDPSDEAHYPLYAAIQDAGVPALFHTGQTGIGAGLPGRARPAAGAVRTRCCSTRSPRTSPTCRSSWPTRRCRGRTRRSRSRRTSTTPGSTCPGWSPKYFPASWCAYANSLPEEPRAVRLRLPAADPRPLDRAIAEQTALKPEVMPGIMKHNAARLLGLALTDHPSKEHP